MPSVYGMLFDQTRCIGCKACELACQSEHGQAPHEAVRLDHRSFNWVQRVGKDAFQRHMCMHCEDPTCASVCPVAALQKSHQGPVVWIADRCLGCRYCMMACPFAIPKYEWDSVNPKVCKCDMCDHRVSKGRETACASVCPTGATTFGFRKDLAREAERRARENPQKYAGAIVGDDEVGGTAVLMLMDRDPLENGFPGNLPQEAMPILTWRILEKLPLIIPVWAVFLGGMYWLTGRKKELAGHGGGHA